MFARRRVYVRNRSQPFATVRNRSRVGRMAVPIVSSAKGVTFGCFQRCVAAFRVAGVAFRDIQTCFVTCGKSFCVAGAILLRRFQTMRCSFRGRHAPHSTLNTSHSTLYTLHSALYTLHSKLSTRPSSIFHSLRCTGMVTGETCTRLFKKRFQTNVLRDCMSMCFDICTINIRVSIRVHPVFRFAYRRKT